jgi:hypothetical protein
VRVNERELGVQCETCHGPGERHVAAMQSKKYDEPHIFNPGTLTPLELSQEFCGRCHVGLEQALQMPEQGGVNNVRFQAYRIFKSRGHMGTDPRTSCLACHDPHVNVVHEPTFYDAKCLACHVATPTEPKTEARRADACPVSVNRCTTCHMPKVDLPQMHAKFTDHWIRVVKPGEPAPR